MIVVAVVVGNSTERAVVAMLVLPLYSWRQRKNPNWKAAVAAGVVSPREVEEM
jgi:hypothetical protein